jgi:hypothetical protein
MTVGRHDTLPFVSVMPRSRFGRAAVRILFWVPTLATVAILVVVGLRVGPWWPLGVAVGTVALLAFAHWMSRDVRRLRKTNPAEAQRVAGARADRVGRLLVRWVVAWMALGAILLVVILVAHFA